MQGTIWCVCWDCKDLTLKFDEDLVEWLKDHWGHRVKVMEEIGDHEYESYTLPHEEEEA